MSLLNKIINLKYDLQSILDAYVDHYHHEKQVICMMHFRKG